MGPFEARGNRNLVGCTSPVFFAGGMSPSKRLSWPISSHDRTESIGRIAEMAMSRKRLPAVRLSWVLMESARRGPVGPR